ncbi:MAG: stkP 5 [Labilithrix sp.]|nr:stkP 5 [Labilithrix sp.]
MKREEGGRGIGYDHDVGGEGDAATTAAISLGARPTTDPPAAPHRPAVAGYELLRVVGRGGMGVVWEAIEQRLDRVVALKVHRASTADAAQGKTTLWTEALVAARIGDPSIVSVFDVGYTIDGHPYYAMELVRGTDLGVILADGPLAPRRALAIAADMARAASAAHQLGVIHRDLKPRNVIIDSTERARVCDFGIAFDSRSRDDDPYAGLIAGSPPYMAPEQVVGDRVGPPTDIWAIGVILYEMLTGERPFEGASMDDLFARITLVDPPPPSSKRESIHADLDALVARCLTKAPERRFPSAGALFETLSAIAEGRRIDIAVQSAVRSYAPKISGTMPAVSGKPRRDAAKRRLSWAWRLRSSPEQLWPFVADTDRLNKAVGLTPVEFTDQTRPDGGVDRTGEIQVLGLQVSWREYPFEWIRHREHSVFRWYTTGPIAAIWNKVTFVALPDGRGTELQHDIWLSPRGVIGHVAAFVELDRKLAPAVDRFYRHLDDVLAHGTKVDPFEAPHSPTAEQRTRVEAGCAWLRAEGFDGVIVEQLETLLLTAPDGVVGTLRPFELADVWGTDRAETLDAFIHAAHAGVVEPTWDVICPKCMIAHESVCDLQQVMKHGTCTACATSFERDLKDSVELVFAPHPAARAVSRATFCIGAPAKRPHVIAQQLLEPGEVRKVTIDLPRGSYRLAGSMAKRSAEIVASAVGFENQCEVIFDGERLEGRPTIVNAGSVRLALHNASAAEATIRVETAGVRDDSVSAADALTHPSFRALFSEQLLAAGEHLGVRHLAFLFVELAANEAHFDTVGDSLACADLSRLDDLVADEARQNEGDVVPSALAMSILAFPTSLRAIRAALSLRQRIIAANLTSPLSIAVHDGRCIALTRGGRPEFFGETLFRGQSLLRDCPPGGIALSASVVSDRAVAVAVHESGLSVAVDKAQEGPYAGRRVTLLLP